MRGAFTGAISRKKGKFALADGGTILLDEVGSMSKTLQPKLLRVLQEREIEPLGAEQVQIVDVRVIAATNRDLKKMIADGDFQEDLFYRLSVFPIVIPPLRERTEDIPALARHFVEKHSRRIGRRIDAVSEQALETLRAYDWPGNVRELENTIERAVVLSNGATIEPGRDLHARRYSAAQHWPPLDGPEEEPRVGGARVRRAGVASGGRRQEAGGRPPRHQPARSELLPVEVLDLAALRTRRIDSPFRAT